jgi:hypothetical protein
MIRVGPPVPAGRLVVLGPTAPDTPEEPVEAASDNPEGTEDDLTAWMKADPVGVSIPSMVIAGRNPGAGSGLAHHM